MLPTLFELAITKLEQNIETVDVARHYRLEMASQSTMANKWHKS